MKTILLSIALLAITAIPAAAYCDAGRPIDEFISCSEQEEAMENLQNQQQEIIDQQEEMLDRLEDLE